MAQADMFLKLTNIKGEALDSKHKDEIEVLSWSFGASQTGSAHGGTGSGAGKVQIQDLTITHYVDQSSTDLLKHLTSGKHIDEGMLVVRKAGGTAVEYFKFKIILPAFARGDVDELILFAGVCLADGWICSGFEPCNIFAGAPMLPVCKPRQLLFLKSQRYSYS